MSVRLNGTSRKRTADDRSDRVPLAYSQFTHNYALIVLLTCCHMFSTGIQCFVSVYCLLFYVLVALYKALQCKLIL